MTLNLIGVIFGNKLDQIRKFRIEVSPVIEFQPAGGSNWENIDFRRKMILVGKTHERGVLIAQKW